MAYEKPVPTVDADSKPYWDGAKNGKLMLQRDKSTGESFLYSRGLAPPKDNKNDVEWFEASGKGEVYSFTICRRPAGPAFKEDCPYVVVSVDTAEGARIMTNLVTDDVEAVKIGMPVEVFFDQVSDDLTIPKFKPAK